MSLGAEPMLRTRDCCRLAVDHTPIVAVGVHHAAGFGPVLVSWLDGHLNGDGVHVEALELVDTVGRGRRNQVQVLEWPQVAQVENGAEVHPERVRALAGEDFDAPGSDWIAALARSSYFGVERGPMRHGGVGRFMPSTSDLSPCTRVTEYSWRRFQLGSVSDMIGPGVVQERRLALDVGREPKLEADVGVGVGRIGDVDRVQHRVAEAIEVRSAGRVLTRDEIGDQGDGSGRVGTDKGVDVGVVGHRIGGDLGRFAV